MKINKYLEIFLKLAAMHKVWLKVFLINKDLEQKIIHFKILTIAIQL
jgi:hypothetical protein